MPYLTPSETPTETRCRRLLIPNDIGWLEVVNGAITSMIYEHNWEQIDGITPAEAAETALAMFLAYQSSDCECEDVPVRLVGSIFPYATINPPVGCLPCDGTTYNAADYPDLYTLLDSAFIISGTQFRTPDMRGRAPIGAGTGSGLSARAVGATGGAEAVTLGIGEMPAHTHPQSTHTHSVGDSGHSHGVTDPGHNHAIVDPGHTHTIPGRNSTTDGTGVPRLANSASSTTNNNTSSQTTGISVSNHATGVSVNSGTTGITIGGALADLGASGGGGAHNNMQPFIALKYAIVALP